jgi:hypothetical protein
VSYFTDYFGRVKNPCGDCVGDHCTMNCSGRELILPGMPEARVIDEAALYRFVNCEACGTEGRILTNDGGPDDVDHGPCPDCGGQCVVEIETAPLDLSDFEDCFG